MTYSRVEEVAVVNSQRFVAKEEFRASGVKWVRYQDAKEENRYVSQEEWDEWVVQSRSSVPSPNRR